MDAARASAGLREFARPLPLTAAAILALNDHLLKGAGLFPSWLTGKLSDVAGLFFFPILLFSLVGLIAPSRHRAVRATILALVTGGVFAGSKVVGPIHGWVESLLGVVVMDRTDLVALPVLALSVLYLRAAPAETPDAVASRGRWADVRNGLGVAFAGLASMATSAPRMARAYPAWQVAGATTLALDCADVTPFVVKSGKEGVGVVVAVRARASCGDHIVSAHVTVDGARFPGVGGVSTRDVPTSTVRTYVGFSFDNNTLWNEGKRDGSLELEFETGEGSRRLVFDLREVWPATHALEGGAGP